MTFRWEEDLRSSFAEYAEANLWSTNNHRSRFITAIETTCSEGRADFVWATGELRRRPTLQKNARIFSRPTSSRILSSLKPSSPRTEQFLLKTCGVAPNTLRRHLQELLHESLVRETSPERFVLGRRYYLPRIEICSFEFKLTDWRRALYQATRYRTFSHRVFVVIPPDTAHAASAFEDLFLKLNIGLIVHDGNGQSTRLISCRKRNPTSQYRYMMAVGMLFSEGI